jgi:hypothetical protein
MSNPAKLTKGDLESVQVVGIKGKRKHIYLAICIPYVIACKYQVINLRKLRNCK